MRSIRRLARFIRKTKPISEVTDTLSVTTTIKHQVIHGDTTPDEFIDNAVSLNDKKNNTVVIWFEPTFFVRNEFQKMADKLRTECHNVDIYTDIDPCIDSLTKIKLDFKVYLLVSGLWAAKIFEHLGFVTTSKKLINMIFIYSSSPRQYEFLQEQGIYNVQICNSLEDIWNVIHPCTNKRCEVLRLYDQRTIRDLSSEETIAAFIWFMAFKDALFQLPRDEKAKDDMLEICRRFYLENKAQVALIDEYKKTYRPEDAPKWFSRSSFLYKLINRALRTQDVEQLYVFRYFIRDLSAWISSEFRKIKECKEEFFLFRGAKLSQEDFRSLAPGKLLAPNGFFSSSRDIKIAELVAFADISGVSLMPDEKEVLFDLGITFEIEDIEPQSSEQDYVVIHLVPSCEGTHLLHSYRQAYRNEMESSSAAIRFGILLFKTGKYTAAQHYFEQLLNDPCNESISDIHYCLGWTYMRQNGHEQAIINFERAYDLTSENDTLSRARILDSTGKALVEKGFVKEALDYYQKALDLRITCLGFDHKDVANSFNNVARLHIRTGNPRLAIRYYKRSIDIDTDALELITRENNSITTEETDSMQCSGSDKDSFNEICDASECDRVSSSLYELGTVLCELGESTSGLHNMKQSFRLRKHSAFYSTPDLNCNFCSYANVSPLIRPRTNGVEYRLYYLEEVLRRPLKSEVEIIDALKSVGYAYAPDGKFQDALQFYLQALKRQKNHSKCSLELTRTLNSIGDMYHGLHQVDKALTYYRKAVSIYEKLQPTENRDRLRTMNKISKLTQETVAKTNAASKTSFFHSKSASSSPCFNRREEATVQRSESARLSNQNAVSSRRRMPTICSINSE